MKSATVSRAADYAAPRTVERLEPINQDSPAMRWLKNGLNAKTVFTIISIGAGFIATHYRDEARLDQMVLDIKEIKTAYVPRPEHKVNDEWLKRTLETFNERLENIERTLLERGNTR